LRLAKEHDFIILEDDAYAYLYYVRPESSPASGTSTILTEARLLQGDSPKPRSYFAMEAEINGEVGRVMRWESLLVIWSGVSRLTLCKSYCFRFDSFSKILSSGMRLGFITAPKRVCDLIVLNTANVK
jgi:tryptophan aminotransferase